MWRMYVLNLGVKGLKVDGFVVDKRVIAPHARLVSIVLVRLGT